MRWNWPKTANGFSNDEWVEEPMARAALKPLGRPDGDAGGRRSAASVGAEWSVVGHEGASGGAEQ
jgi:hypothetical protein